MYRTFQLISDACPNENNTNEYTKQRTSVSFSPKSTRIRRVLTLCVCIDFVDSIIGERMNQRKKRTHSSIRLLFIEQIEINLNAIQWPLFAHSYRRFVMALCGRVPAVCLQKFFDSLASWCLLCVQSVGRVLSIGDPYNLWNCVNLSLVIGVQFSEYRVPPHHSHTYGS